MQRRAERVRVVGEGEQECRADEERLRLCVVAGCDSDPTGERRRGRQDGHREDDAEAGVPEQAHTQDRPHRGKIAAALGIGGELDRRAEHPQVHQALTGHEQVGDRPHPVEGDPEGSHQERDGDDAGDPCPHHPGEPGQDTGGHAAAIGARLGVVAQHDRDRPRPSSVRGRRVVARDRRGVLMGPEYRFCRSRTPTAGHWLDGSVTPLLRRAGWYRAR